MKTFVASFLLFFFSITIFAQKQEYSIIQIPDSLKQDANAVLRLGQIDIAIASQRNMTIKVKRVVTVFNEKGISCIDAYEYYDKKRKVQNIQATVFDAFGTEIKKIKRKDFKDQSVTGGSTIFSDNRVVFLEYTPTQYPFTIIYESEIETSTTAFIPQWFPLSDYYLGVEKSVLNVTYPDNLGFKKMEFNFDPFNIKKNIDTATQLSYTASHILAQKKEDYSLKFSKMYPKLMMGLEFFNLEGVDGNVKNWKEYGQWFSDKILTGTTDLSPETIAKIKSLVGTETDPIKKAKIVYKYMQDKSRYVSIQVGIGGFKPMLASDVDRLGYGDCKALSNYTRALLDAVGVPSYNTILYGDRKKWDIESDFVSTQGNHMILAIPNAENYVFLECTSQDNPFGYQANFTDDRAVLVLKPNGGEIVRTKAYNDKNNTQINTGAYKLDENGNFSGIITMASEGAQYSEKAEVEKMLPNEKEAHYKDYWSTIGNLKLDKIKLIDNKEKIIFTEELALSADNYGKITNGKMFVVVNAYSQFTHNIKRIRSRKTPFEIERGSLDTDEISINLPIGYTIEFLPSNFELNTKFGEYKTEIIKKDNQNLVYKRSFFVKKGFYKNTEFDDFRLFMEQIARNDNAKIILTKNQ